MSPVRSAVIVSLSAALVTAAGCGRGERPAVEGIDVEPLKIARDVEERLAEFAPMVIEADLSGLDETEIEVLRRLVEASRLLDPVFLRQADAENPTWRERIAASGGETAAALALFDHQYGIYERQHGNRPFVEGVPSRPPGAGLYPADLTREELDTFLASHPDREAEILSHTSIVVRDGEMLAGVPYSRAYGEWLDAAAAELGAAASATRNDSLRAYLAELQRALSEDVYRAAESAWMDVDGPIEITFGPYETYEDDLLGTKGAFASFVTVADPEASAKLDALVEELPRMEQRLPIPDEHKNPNRGTESPIRVVDLVFSSGDARAGVQTLAFNLPNDEEIREAKGSKKVLLRNVMAAKFRAILAPIAARVIAEDQVRYLDETAFVDFVLYHEVSHALGPGRIAIDGGVAEVRDVLLESYDTIEEAKADVVGLWNLTLRARERGDAEEELKRLFVTHAAGLFRSARFGTGSAHGRAAAIQYSLLRDAGAIVPDGDGGRIRVDVAAFERALAPIVRDVLMIEALGDRDGAKALIDARGTARNELAGLDERLEGIPVDVRPVYPFAGESL